MNNIRIINLLFKLKILFSNNISIRKLNLHYYNDPDSIKPQTRQSLNCKSEKRYVEYFVDLMGIEVSVGARDSNLTIAVKANLLGYLSYATASIIVKFKRTLKMCHR